MKDFLMGLVAPTMYSIVLIQMMKRLRAQEKAIKDQFTTIGQLVDVYGALIDSLNKNTEVQQKMANDYHDSLEAATAIAKAYKHQVPWAQVTVEADSKA